MRVITGLVALAAMAMAPAAAAQDWPDDEITDADSDGVLAVVDAFMAALAAKDADAMRALVTQPGFLAMVQEREGEDRVGLMAMEDVIAALAAIPDEIAEPLWGEVVMVEGPVAMAWANFDFLRDGTRTHCGVDVFTLLRVDGKWKIATVTYSHVEQGCR